MVSWAHQNVVLNMILPVIFIIKSITLSCLIGSLHLAQKYVPIFVREHYLFPESKSIVYCRKEADNFQGQTSQYIFALNRGFCGFWSFKCLSHYSKFKIGEYSSDILKYKKLGLDQQRDVLKSIEHERRRYCWFIITAAASEPEGNERGSSLTSRRLHYRGLPQGIVVKLEWEDLGCAAYQSHV